MQQAQGDSLDELVQDAARRMVAVLGPDLAFVKLLFIEAVEFNGQHIPILFEIIYPEVLAFVEGLLVGARSYDPYQRPSCCGCMSACFSRTY